MTTSFDFTAVPTGEGGLELDEAAKDMLFAQVPGLVGNPTATQRCATADFLTSTGNSEGFSVPDCPDDSAVGVVAVKIANETTTAPLWSAVYNLVPPPGDAAALGFWSSGIPVPIDAGVSEAPPYTIRAGSRNISQIVEVTGAEFTLWGVPADPAHDPLRGACLRTEGGGSACEKPGGSLQPFLTLPRACRGPLATTYVADSWQHPGALLAGGEPDLSDPNWVSGQALTHDETGSPQGFIGCDKLAFAPEIDAAPTTRSAQSASGLEFSLDVSDEGLANPDPEAYAASDIEKTVVTLPVGMSVNPSQAEGLEVCTEAQLARESSSSRFGAGCPAASKIGTIEVETPLLEDQVLRGSLFVAAPYENPTGSLIAVYVVIRDPELGIFVRQPIEVSPDPRTGQLVSTATEMPQLPFSHFRLRFREGARAPLISPPGCGRFDTVAKLYPYAGGPPRTSTSSFEIVSGPGGSPCPSGAAPFRPGFEAGTLNNQAGSYSPFAMRLTRGDGEQDITKLSATLPPGVAGRIAGIPWCPEAGIALAASRQGPHGGAEELAVPSCPAASQIGTSLAGAGVGNQLTYVGGSLYLAGPYRGDPLSVVSITPAVAGPFDAGTVVVRIALTLNPRTGEVEADGSASDPIPHILKGIPLNVRDLHVSVDRPGFTLNATSCAEEQARARLFGGGTVLAPLPDTPVDLSARYQAAGCAGLRFKPRLAIKLRGGVKRGAHPALRAVVTPRPGQANFKRAVVTLPRSAFLEQAHIRTVCTRVQFAAAPGHGARCPNGARYGYARAWSPLLDGPARGPVYLRSSNNKLPDLVVALKGPASAPVDVELSARIDSVRGGIRSTFAGIPDLPVSRFILDMQGGNKGLIVNSRHLCHKPKRNRVRANLKGQNGRRAVLRPVVRAVKCAKKNGKQRKRDRKRGGSR